jgi:hypothetical protein
MTKTHDELTATPRRKMSIGGVVASVPGWIAGYALAQYSKGSFLLPAALAVGFALLGAWILPKERKALVTPLAVGAAHIGWFLFGAFSTSNTPIFIEAAIYAALLLWLGVRPNLFSLSALVCYELLSLAVNVAVIVQAQFGSPAHRAILIHILLRTLVIGSSIYGVVIFRRARRIAGMPAPS